MLIPRWRNVLILKNSITPSSTTLTTATQFASFHSTPATCEKWKNKWNDDVRGAQQPSKGYSYKMKSSVDGFDNPKKRKKNEDENYARYEIRQKRTDAKKALKDLLFNNGCSNVPFQGEDPIWKLGGDSEKVNNKKGRSKFSARRAAKFQHQKKKSKARSKSFSEDYNDPETIFHATFGNRWYTWSFNSFQSSTSGFEWREQSNWSKRRTKEWQTRSEIDSDDESFTVGSSSDRTILDLPPTGPLKIEDVKNAFRSSALKWHPDKHQGPSQAIAEEKFKLCVTAYKSLCDALARA